MTAQTIKPSEVKTQYLSFKRAFRALVADKDKFYSDDITGRCSLVKLKDGSRHYKGNFKVVTVSHQIGVYGSDFGDW